MLKCLTESRYPAYICNCIVADQIHVELDDSMPWLACLYNGLYHATKSDLFSPCNDHETFLLKQKMYYVHVS